MNLLPCQTNYNHRLFAYRFTYHNLCLIHYSFKCNYLHQLLRLALLAIVLNAFIIFSDCTVNDVITKHCVWILF